MRGGIGCAPNRSDSPVRLMKVVKFVLKTVSGFGHSMPAIWTAGQHLAPAVHRSRLIAVHFLRSIRLTFQAGGALMCVGRKT
jgi:hypothetical protein